jgi:hypothetical protein
VENTVFDINSINLLRTTYERNLRDVISILKNASIETFISSPSIFAERPHGLNPLDAKLDDYRRINKRVSADMDVHFIDIRRTLLSVIPSSDIICGLPSTPIFSKWSWKLQFNLGNALTCWLPYWISNSLTRYLLSFKRMNGLGTRDEGKLTVDGEHLSQTGANIAGNVFANSLSEWIESFK